MRWEALQTNLISVDWYHLDSLIEINLITAKAFTERRRIVQPECLGFSLERPPRSTVPRDAVDIAERRPGKTQMTQEKDH